LDYIAIREGIPVDRLLVVNQHQREYDVLDKVFWYVKVLDHKGRHFYTALVDLGDQTPTELEEVEKANSQALNARYGKLEPRLHELLQTRGPDDEMTIAIWFAPLDYEAVLAQLRAKYPQVSLELPESPWVAVRDRALSAQIEADWVQLLQEAHLAKQEDLAQSLRSQGYTVRPHRGVPSLVARLPKRAILEIAQRADVTRLYLIEGRLNLLLDKAIPTARGDVVWQRGIDGAAERIAIVEPGEVNLWHAWIDVKERRLAADQIEHTSWVASAAASFHSTYKGMAPSVDIYSAGVDEQNDQWDDVDDAILWANNRGCKIMNASFTSDQGERTDRMQWIDRVFDYWARNYKITMIAAAGNQEQGNHIGSPAKGYNVLAVGGSDDKRNPSWSDDEMWPHSSWKNPMRGDETYGDREKPEVVASAYGLTLLNNDGSTQENRQGTSYSAPQVAGLAALLVERNDDLLIQPEAMRAIIMASAVHNVDGPSGIPTGPDLKDGAGAIDAALADSIAGLGYEDVYQYPYPACEKPCWWSNYVYNNYPGHPANFPPGTYRWYYFKATRGERIRVALAWVSDAVGPGGGYGTDLLRTDLDLAVYEAGGQEPVTNGYSASNDNSYEIVDFVAEKTGQYAIGVYKKADTTEFLNWIGLAWVRDATYLPGIQSDYGGWDSDIMFRNDDASTKDATSILFSDDGDWAGGQTCENLPSNKVCVYDPPYSNFLGSAIVAGSGRWKRWLSCIRGTTPGRCRRCRRLFAISTWCSP
jgi:hypothetical protein